LGILPFGHDTCVAFVKDGRLVSAVEEERFDRIKHTFAFPERAISWTLSANRLKPEEIDAIGVPWDPAPLHRSGLYIIPTILRRNFQPFYSWVPFRDRGAKDRMRGLFGPGVRIFFFEHHLAHAASVFFTSGSQSAAVVTVDGQGEQNSTVVWKAKGEGIEKLREYGTNQSLGMFYDAATVFIGFPKILEGVGKTMALAPYGKMDDEIHRKLSELLRITEDGYKVRGISKTASQTRGFTAYLAVINRIFGPSRTERPSATDPKATNFAFVSQRMLEEAMLSLCRYAKRETHEQKLLLAGGTALNAKANMELRESGTFESIGIMPAAHDAGSAVGAAFLASLEVGDRIDNKFLAHAYLGPSFTKDEVRAELDRAKIHYTETSDVGVTAATLLENGKFVSVFSGSEELGPRALGHRSILADPRRTTMWAEVNTMKGRELWRPLAPSLLLEDAAEYYEGGCEAPFMIMTFKAKEKARELAPAVTHINGTARIQTVAKEVNPDYYSIISEFGRRTGVPIIMNTSFNLAGEPLVNSPRDAVRSFFSSGMDAMIMENLVISK
jgi:carbamoyltransferase